MKQLAPVLALAVLAAAPGCSGNGTKTSDAARTDVATLAKFVMLRPVPVEARWSVTPIGAQGGFGPTDTVLWAIVRYSDADHVAVSRALKAGETLPFTAAGAPPAWLSAEVDLARFRRGSDYVFEQAVSGKPFASGMYSDGFALPLSDRRVLIRFSSR